MNCGPINYPCSIAFRSWAGRRHCGAANVAPFSVAYLQRPIGVEMTKRFPKHIGIIPDGNRRWARARALKPGEGYAAGIQPGFDLMARCIELGIEEVSVYGFTHENTHRPPAQKPAFTDACVKFVEGAIHHGIALAVIGDSTSRAFPHALLPYANCRTEGGIRVNMLINYGWEWDIREASAA